MNAMLDSLLDASYEAQRMHDANHTELLSTTKQARLAMVMVICDGDGDGDGDLRW